MNCPPLTGVLVALALVVATAAPPGQPQPDRATGSKRVPAMRKPASSRKGLDQPAREPRPGRWRPGQPYFTGHRSVAFLRTGEIDVMGPFPDGVESVSSVDSCFGCCGDGGNHIPITTNKGPARGASSNRDASASLNNIKVDPESMVINSLGGNSYSIADRCLGCCVAETDTPSPPTTRKEGVTVVRPASTSQKESTKKTPVKSAQKQPSQQPKEKALRRRPSSASSSEEEDDEYMATRRGGATVRGRAEGAQPLYRSPHPRNEATLCPRGGCLSEEDYSSQSSSEEARASNHVRIWDLQHRPARRG